MKRHALFFATALAVASLGTAGLAAAQSAAAPANDAGTTGTTTAARQGKHRGDRSMRHGKAHFGRHGGHAMRGGIERMDADEDGRVSRAEFDAAMAERAQARAERMAQRQQAGADAPRRARAERAGAGMGEGMKRGPRMGFDFDAIDADKDGYIVRSEVTAHHERMQERMRDTRTERFAEAFAAADLNGDGRLSRVEVDEKMPRLSKRFAWMDDNRDGFLDRAELVAGKRR